MAKKKHNIHDAYVKETFSDRNRAIVFFESFLPKEILDAIDINSLIVTKETYINADLNEHFSDLVFEVSIPKMNEKANLSLLFEHKSEPDKNVVFQIGHYVFSQWISSINNKIPLKPIIPIIYYQGKRKWKIPKIKERFGNYPLELINQLPELPFVYIPLRDIKDEVIITLRNSLLSMALLSQKTKINPIKLEEDIKRIIKLFDPSDEHWNFLEMSIVYILRQSDIEPITFVSAIEEIPDKIKHNIMTTYDQFIEQGVKIGVSTKTEEVVINCFHEKFSISIIANITKLTETEVTEILVRKRLM